MRKRQLMFFLIAVLSMLGATAFADEILFRNIPWYSNVTVVQEAIQSSVEDEIILDAVDNIPMVLVSALDGDFTKVNRVGSVDYPSGWMIVSPLSWFDFKVAGYGVDNLYLYCCYDVQENAILTDIDHSKLYLAAYQFNAGNAEEAYSDLRKKMISLYGEGDAVEDDYSFSSGDTSIDRTTRWYGENSTVAVLSYQGYRNSDGSFLYQNLWLTYSKAEADDLIKAICEIQSSASAEGSDSSGL